MATSESREMYLETILILSGQRKIVRATDVGEHIGFSKPAVSRALGILKNEGLVSVEQNGAIVLTAVGRKTAESIYERHNVLTAFFIALGVDEETAAADACRIEHTLSDKTFEAIKKHAKI